MIDLSEDNDPMLFAVGLPCGRLVVQYMEILATVQASVQGGVEPSTNDVVKAIRESSRTPDVAQAATDAMLVAAWHRMTTKVSTAGNG